MKSSLSALAMFAAVVTLFGALWLAIGNTSDWFLPNLGLWLAAWVLGLGNVLVLLLNVLRWRFWGAPSWLLGIMGLQALPAAVCLGILGYGAYGMWRDSQVTVQVVRIDDAIVADDPQRLTQAQAACGALCAARLSLNEQLLRAAEDGSSRVADQLIRQTARVSSDLGQPERDERTCDGLYLVGLNALSIAAARNDLRMVRLMWPVSDTGSRRRALWTAAQTDHLAMVQWLVGAGVPLSIRGDILDENNTLLVAAASGAAVHVGQWLIESRHMPVDAILEGPDPYTGTAPVWALFMFMSEVGVTHEAVDLLRLLAAHGADVDVRERQGDSPLEEAVRLGQKRIARLLLNAGANPARLDAAQRAAMDKLLSQPDEVPYDGRPSPNCIVAHDAAPVGVSATAGP